VKHSVYYKVGTIIYMVG